MKFARAMLVISVSVFASTIIHAAQIDAASWNWDFESDPVGQAPSSFSFARTGSGRIGRWIVQAEKGAPSGAHVLAQLDADPTSYRFPVAIPNKISARDFRLSVRCKPISGKVDQSCGIVFRYRDENNYYVTRANALENNVRFYYVQDGNRHQIADWSGPVRAGVWHELRVEARGDRFSVFWDGQNVINASDKIFPDGVKIGLWTKADSVTYFDDLVVEAK